jgi:hypothetical protein
MPTYKDITIHSWYLTPQKVDVLAKELVIQSKSLDYILKLAKKNKLLSAIPAIQPVRNENLKRIFLVLDTVQIHLLKLVKCTKGWTLLQK